MSLAIRLDGADAEAVSFDGSVLSVIAARPLAPGQPGSVVAALGGDAVTLSARCAGSRRRDDGRFDVRLRLVSVRREHLKGLGELLGSA